MSLLDFQRALAELVMSPRFCARAAADPQEALSSYELSERERLRIAEVARDPRVRAGTRIHRSFRLSMLSNVLPKTCKVLGGPGIKEWVGAYWRERLPRSYIYAVEAARFGEFALERIRRGEFTHELMPEVLELELALLALARGAVWEPPSLPPSGPLPPPSQELLVRLHPACRLVRFRHDPEELLPALDAGQVPAAPARGEHFLLLAAVVAPGPPSALGPRRGIAHLKVGRGWGLTLAACDPAHPAPTSPLSVAVLCAALEPALPSPLATLSELLAAGYLVRGTMPSSPLSG